MQRFLLLILSLCLSVFSWSQSKDIKINRPNTPKKDKTYIPDANKDPAPTNPRLETGDATADVEAVVLQLFDAMHESDASKIRSLFASDGRIVGTESNGDSKIITIEDFVAMISQSPAGSLEEKVTSMEIRVDDALATAWVGYDFFVNGNFTHCGYDAFQLHRDANGWKILQIADTRHDRCAPAGPEAEIKAALDGWHQAAARANGEVYFDLLSHDGYFLGTDPAEHWNKAEFKKFAQPFFSKGQAWNFKPYDRHVYFSKSGQVAWFNELLDTWMGKCRGSGVMTKDDSGTWKLKQYNLAILVPNDIVQDYVQLLEDRP